MPDDKAVVPADDLEVLAGADDKAEKKEVKEVKEGEEEVVEDEEEVVEDEEDKEEGEEEEKEDEKELELGPRRPTFKEVKAKYPEFFKDFPDLREAFFRESEYTKVFSTVEDAKDAAEELSSLSVVRDKVLEGDFGAILESAREADVASYDKLVANILPDLYKLDQAAFLTAITPSIENMLRTAHRDAVASQNEDLQNSALHISKWFFGTEEVATGKTTTVKATPVESKETKALAAERAEFEATKFRDAYGGVISDRDVAMENLILKGLDPDGELTKYVKTKLIKDVIDEVDKALQKDSSHMALMNAKWRRAKQEGYSADVKSNILSAYLGRAKSLIPSIRSRLRAEATGKVVTKEKAQRAEEVTARKEVPAGAPASRSDRLPNPKDIDWGSVSDTDILAGNIKTRR